MCAVTRQVQPIEELIRFVVGPDGEVVPDLKCKLPGRGLWVSASRDTLGEAIRRGVFGRGFKREVRVSPDLVAGKAGEVVAGFTKVEAALGAGQAAMLLHASDGAADGIRKLDAIARQNTGETAPFPILCALTSAELDLALGRSNVIHAALRAGPAVRTVLDRCRSVLRFRATPEQRANKAAATTIAATTTSRLKDAPTGRPQD